jgi:hypothetical protein
MKDNSGIHTLFNRTVLLYCFIACNMFFVNASMEENQANPSYDHYITDEHHEPGETVTYGQDR